MKDKFPLKHKTCGQIVYWYDVKPVEGGRIVAELIHKASDEQPDPEPYGRPYCHICKENLKLDKLDWRG